MLALFGAARAIEAPRRARAPASLLGRRARFAPRAPRGRGAASTAAALRVRGGDLGLDAAAEALGGAAAEAVGGAAAEAAAAAAATAAAAAGDGAFALKVGLVGALCVFNFACWIVPFRMPGFAGPPRPLRPRRFRHG